MSPRLMKLWLSFLFPFSFHLALPHPPGWFPKNVSWQGPPLSSCKLSPWLLSSAPPWKAATNPPLSVSANVLYTQLLEMRFLSHAVSWVSFYALPPLFSTLLLVFTISSLGTDGLHCTFHVFT